MDGMAAGPAVPIWDLPEAGERGPKARHDRAAIAAAAIRIADTGGLAAVSMRRVAAALGMGTMSLYNYVPAKEHLIQLMVDQAGGEHAYPASPPADIRAAIAALAQQSREIARRHPWLREAIMNEAPPMGPNALRFLDYFLGLLAATPLDTTAKMEVVSLVNGFALMYGGMEGALAAGAAGAARMEERTAGQVATLLQAAATGRYPHLAAALAAGGGTTRDADETFRSAVLRLVDGLLA